MKTQSTIQSPKMALATAPLHDLVSRLTESLTPAAMRNKSFIVNDVPHHISADVNEDLLASVLSKLMNVVIMNTGNSCIRITAKSYGNVVLLHVMDDGCLNYESISQNLTRIQSLAERLGGFVGFTSSRNKLTTIALSFTNMPVTA
jgi:K+-sensing histidine kinase KdpD